jgi:DNA-binding MarR family transcriptional regulator
VAQERIMAWLNLLQTHRVVLESIEAKLGVAAGLTAAEHEVLARLAIAEGGRLRMLQLANLLLLSKSGMTRLVDRLVGAGLVNRTTLPSDRRVVYAEITRSGRSALQRSMDAFADGVDEAFGRHLSDADVKTLRRLLRKVLEGSGHWEEERCSPRLRTAV